MAADEWLFSHVMEKPGRIALRLYTWERGAITFGLNQKLEKAVNRNALGNTPLIRRITGGRALYHDPSELTYAIAANVEGLMNKKFGLSVGNTARSIAKAMKVFLKDQNIESDYIRQSPKRNLNPDYFHSAPCFDSKSRYELVSSGHKIVASSQRRIGMVILQHGAIKLGGVAQHPALGGRSTKVDSLPTLSSESFTSLAESFIVSIGKSLDLSIVLFQPSLSQKQAIIYRAEYIRKNALSRRDIVKQ